MDKCLKDVRKGLSHTLLEKSQGSSALPTVIAAAYDGSEALVLYLRPFSSGFLDNFESCSVRRSVKYMGTLC